MSAGYKLPVWPWGEYLGEIDKTMEEVEKLESEQKANEEKSNAQADEKQDEKTDVKTDVQKDVEKDVKENTAKTNKKKNDEKKATKKKTKKKVINKQPLGDDDARLIYSDPVSTLLDETSYKLFAQFDAHKGKISDPGRISWHEIQSYIDDAKIPNLSYESYVGLEPEEDGNLDYKAWTALIVKKVAAKPPPKELLPTLRTLLKKGLKGMAKAVKETQKLHEKEKKARHKSVEMDTKHYKPAAQVGDKKNAYFMGSCYHFGRKGIKKDMEKAVKWYKKAADRDYAPAQCALAYCYDTGKGVERDLEAAFTRYSVAAKLGLSRAQRCLAICYEYGRGTSKDLEKAQKWYARAASNETLVDEWAEYTMTCWDHRHHRALGEDGIYSQEGKEAEKGELDDALAKTAARVQATLAKVADVTETSATT